MYKQIGSFRNRANKTLAISGVIIALNCFGAQPAPAALTQPQTPCTDVTAYETAGSWRKQAGDDLAMADSSFPKVEHRSVLLKAQKVIELLKLANPSFKGIEAVAYRGIRGKSYFPNGALKFAVNSGYFEFFCVPNTNGYKADARGKVMPGGEYGTVINVYFNDFGWALESIEGEGQFLTADGEALFYMPKQLGDFRGMTLLQPDSVRSEGKQEAVIITPNSRLPYKAVTREQFIQSRIKYYREFYQAQRRSSFEPVIAELNSLLANMSPTARQTQAIIRDPFETKDRLFVTEAKGGKRVITIDKDFFNPKLPRPAIQFITVYWGWDHKHPAVAEAIRQLKQNFDFEALKQMLGK